jgi:hypothetical protein
MAVTRPAARSRCSQQQAAQPMQMRHRVGARVVNQIRDLA